jgi:hypothetical protein
MTNVTFDIVGSTHIGRAPPATGVYLSSGTQLGKVRLTYASAGSAASNFSLVQGISIHRDLHYLDCVPVLLSRLKSVSLDFLATRPSDLTTLMLFDIESLGFMQRQGQSLPILISLGHFDPAFGVSYCYKPSCTALQVIFETK